MTSSAAKNETHRAAGRDEVEQAAIRWLREDLDDQELTADENFLDIGGHSLTFSKLNAFLGATFGLRLDQKTTYEDSLSAAVSKAETAAEPPGSTGE